MKYFLFYQIISVIFLNIFNIFLKFWKFSNFWKKKSKTSKIFKNLYGFFFYMGFFRFIKKKSIKFFFFLLIEFKFFDYVWIFKEFCYDFENFGKKFQKPHKNWIQLQNISTRIKSIRWFFWICLIFFLKFWKISNFQKKIQKRWKNWKKNIRIMI